LGKANYPQGIFWEREDQGVCSRKKKEDKSLERAGARLRGREKKQKSRSKGGSGRDVVGLRNFLKQISEYSEYFNLEREWQGKRGDERGG